MLYMLICVETKMYFFLPKNLQRSNLQNLLSKKFEFHYTEQ